MLFWNCQGAASRAFRRTFKHFCSEYSPEIVCLFEPKVSGDQANSICFDFGFDEWVRVEAVGFSGGIWVFWKLPLQVEVLGTHPQFINLQVMEQTSTPWVFSAVYGSPNPSLRKSLFSNLSLQAFAPQTQWLACGDFNSVINISEVCNKEHFNSTRCTDFREWIFRESLIDFGFRGPVFTWMRGVNSSTFNGARLDRALCSADWKLRFPDAEVEHLPIANSDHAPLLITTNPRLGVRITKKFRFNMVWTTHKDFLNCIRKAWSTGNDLETNKRLTTEALTVWNVSTFGNVFQRKKRLLARIKGIQNCLSQQPTQNLIKLEKRLREELDETLAQEEILWYQRSREQWISSGDRNTRYYHTATSVNKSFTRIDKLRTENGEWLTDEGTIRSYIRNYFSQLFSENRTSRPQCFIQGHFPRLTEEDWREVNRPFEPEEIKQALFEMDPCKAPGPDGFTAGFYQKAWPIVGNEILKFASDFFLTGTFPTDTNDTVITLIPKVASPESVRQLRPIGLCNVSYKVVTKAMTTRLKDISKKLIGQHQSSFIPERQIADNIIVFQEVLNSMRTRKGQVGWMIMKIDLEKAYDKLSWECINESLSDIGFNTAWKRNIMSCISTSRLAINWSGQQSDWFRPSRGIRQMIWCFSEKLQSSRPRK